MKILVTGSTGLLGSDIIQELNKTQYTVIGPNKNEMDITNISSVEKNFELFFPDAVIHCAAWTAVNDAEDKITEAEFVNAGGTKNIVESCKKYNCKLVYISTDHVFNGENDIPWKPYDKADPINIYGKTKYRGELFVKTLEKHFIIRTSWLFGKNGKNFVDTIIDLNNSNAKMCVVNDQIGTPTYSKDLAQLIIKMINTEKYGTYHVTNEGGYTSWYDFAVEIVSQLKKINLFHKASKIEPVSSYFYSTKARRPKNSRLDKSDIKKNGFDVLPEWKDALVRYLKERENNI